jgi:hypothetical protein
VLSQYSKAEAVQLKETLAQFLKEKLGLTQHPQKTQITHWDKRFRFLGYDLRGRRNPNGIRWLRLEIPPEKERELKVKVKRLCGYTQIPSLDLFMSVNALMRGWTQYFRYANNVTARFGYLGGVVYWLGAHYLGRKHRCSIKKVMRNHYGIDPASGKQALYTTDSQGKRVYIWNKPPSRQSVYSRMVRAKDVQPLPISSWAGGHSYEQRLDLRSRFEQGCEHCGKVSLKLIVHHPNRLGKLRRNKQGAANIIASSQEQRVKLLCPECHKLHHSQDWRDRKTKPKKLQD